LSLEGSADRRDTPDSGRGPGKAELAGRARRPSALRARSGPARTDRGRASQDTKAVSWDPRMIEHLTLGAFTVAFLMSLAALCAFVWGATSGAFRGLEASQYQVPRAEGVGA